MLSPSSSSLSTAEQRPELKIVLVGDSGVGKTHLLSTKCQKHRDFSSGIEFATRLCKVDSKNITAHIWDTSGKECFREIVRGLYRGASGAMIVYDIAQAATFEHCSGWLRELREHSEPNLVVMLVGNKSDLELKRTVPTEKARQFAETNGLMFLECSTVETMPVETVFTCLFAEILRRQRTHAAANRQSSDSNASPTVESLTAKASNLQLTIQRLERELREARQQEATHRQALENEIARRGQLANGNISPATEQLHRWPLGKEISSRSDYTVVNYLGGGNFHRVCLAIRKSDHARFAIKEVNWTGIAGVYLKLSSQQLLDMATKEAEQMTVLQHPNILRVFGFFQQVIDDKMCHHLIMEHFECGELHEILVKRHGLLLDIEQIAPWIEQLCSAVKYLHDREILHRDIKSTNVFCIDGNRSIKLGDFGLSKDAKQASRATIVAERYMAPEVIDVENPIYTNKCDVWSVGLVVYEMACLRLPFDSATANRDEIKEKVLKGVPMPLASSYGSGLQQLVDFLLEKNPVNRFDMAHILRRAVILLSETSSGSD